MGAWICGDDSFDAGDVDVVDVARVAGVAYADVAEWDKTFYFVLYRGFTFALSFYYIAGFDGVGFNGVWFHV